MSEALLEALKNGDVTSFNAERPAGRLDLYAADLGSAQLPGVDLSGADLENADLSGAVLSDAMLARTRLGGTDCTGAKLDGVMALKSKWRGAYLGEADLSAADLTAADLSDAELPDITAEGLTLSAAKLNGADLTGAKIPGVILTEARLNGATLTKADLTGGELAEASLLEADLTEAVLSGADLTRARLSSAVLKGADLRDAVLRGADLTGADLTGAKLAGADLRRADLTEAILEDVDLSDADLTDAQLDPDVAAAVGQKPSVIDLPEDLWIDEPTIAVADGRVCMLFEHEDDEGRRLRVIAGSIRGKAPRKAAGIPVPADLVLAKTMVPTDDGFAVMALVERPAGIMATIVPIDTDGMPGPARNIRMPFTPSVRPVLRWEEGELRIYGIGREGPALHVMRIGEEGFESIHASRMSTARGFVSAQDPVVLSKGGVAVELTASGPGRPISTASGFPGRSPCATPVDQGIAFAWAERGQPGFYFMIGVPGESSEPRRHLPDDLAGALDIKSDGDGAWMAWTQEPLVPGTPASAWVARLPGGKAMELELPDAEDASQVQFVTGTYGKNDDPVVAMSPGDGTWHLFSIGARGPKLRWSSGPVG